MCTDTIAYLLVTLGRLGCLNEMMKFLDAPPVEYILYKLQFHLQPVVSIVKNKDITNVTMTFAFIFLIIGEDGRRCVQACDSAIPLYLCDKIPFRKRV